MAEEATQRITDETKEAERAEMHVEPGAPQRPTPEEEEAAERAAPASEDTKESYKEMVERGADQKGEGRIP